MSLILSAKISEFSFQLFVLSFILQRLELDVHCLPWVYDTMHPNWEYPNDFAV